MFDNQQNYQPRELATRQTSTPVPLEPQSSPANHYTFSLSSLFLVVTAIALLCGLWVNFPLAALIATLFTVPTEIVYLIRYYWGPRAGNIHCPAEQIEEFARSFVLVLMIFAATFVLFLVFGFLVIPKIRSELNDNVQQPAKLSTSLPRV